MSTATAEQPSTSTNVTNSVGRRREPTPTTRHPSAASESTVTTQQPPHNNNIWDSAWSAINQVPPPGLTEVLGAYAQKGENDREMLLRILQAKSAEDERIASVASLHRTILELQSATLAAQNAQAAQALVAAGLSSPGTTPPLNSPPTHYAHPRLRRASSSHGHSPPQTHHERTPSYSNQPNGASSSSSSYPTLPPIATMSGMTYGEPPRKRSRISPPATAPASRDRASPPEYPLSPYSGETSSSNTRGAYDVPRRQVNGYASTSSWSNQPPPYANGTGASGAASARGRVSVNSLLGAGSEEDGDVKYRRLSAERSSR